MSEPLTRSLSPRRLGCILALFALLSSGCSVLSRPQISTLLPEAYIPTVIALTLDASRLAWTPTPTAVQEPATPQASATPTRRPSPTATLKPPLAASVTGSPPGPSATPFTLEAPSPTPTPAIPNAEIEIRNLGAYSKVVSPLHLYTYLLPGAGGKVRIELLGEDNRLLARQVRTLNFVPVGAWAVMALDLDFEIAATAEEGRLQISVDDEYKRTVALNSVPLILLSVGEADVIPPQDVLAPIILREPTKRTLIQGGKLQVSGLARVSSDKPLLARLITAQGAEVGMRLVDVSEPASDGYRYFSAEVPYKITDPLRALLIVTEGDEVINDIIHLTSLEVMLSP
jgi:hypothetical protein